MNKIRLKVTLPSWISCRNLSLNEVAVALRPFFFAVHPDRFAAHPEIRKQNEKSLQVFNGYMNDLFPISPSLRPVNVSFTIMDKKKTGSFQSVNLKLAGTDPVRIVREALTSCQLEIKNLNLPKTTNPEFHQSSASSTSYEKYSTSNIDEDLLKMYLRKKKQAKMDLQSSLSAFREEAIRKSKETSAMLYTMKDEIDDLKRRTGIRDVIWQMDWAESHMKRCIFNLNRLIDQTEKGTKDAILQACYKNVIKFGRGSFTCCDGSIQLGADHVPEQWEQIFLEHSVRRSQMPELKMSVKQLSETLGGATVLLPHFKGLAQTLNQMKSLITRMWAREALLLRLERAAAGTMIEVVTSYDELAIGLDGRLFIPCNVDIASLVTFLEANGKKSQEINHQMQALVNELETTKKECVRELNLVKLEWESTLDATKILDCFERLLNANEQIRSMVGGLSLVISLNPSVYIRNDGSLSLPYNWA